MSVERKLKRIASLVNDAVKKSGESWLSGRGGNLYSWPECVVASLRLNDVHWADNVLWFLSPAVLLADGKKSARVCVSWNGYGRHRVRVFINDLLMASNYDYPVFNNRLLGGWSWRMLSEHYDSVINELEKLSKTEER